MYEPRSALILNGPGYNMAKPLQSANKWSKTIKIVASFFILIGIIQTIGALCKIGGDNDFELEIEDIPLEEGAIELPEESLFFAGVFDLIGGVLTVVLGRSCLKVSKSPSRGNTWCLWKKAFFIIIIQAILMTLSFAAVFIGYALSFTEWLEGKDIMDENYAGTDEETEEQIIEIAEVGFTIGFTLLFTFFFACCCMIGFSSCILGGLYKFHATAKEQEMIHGVPQQFAVNQQILQPQPQVVYYQPQRVAQPQAINLQGVHTQALGGNVLRGQVVMQPQTQ